MSNRPGSDTPAPDFTLPDGNAKPVRLGAYRGKNVVLVFYPADWSPVCTNELAVIQELREELRAFNTDVLAVSVDGRWSHRAWAEHMHLTFPLLSDFWPHGQVARAYGVYREADGTSERALFFIDAAGVIRDSWVAPKPTIAPGMNIILGGAARLSGALGAEPRP